MNCRGIGILLCAAAVLCGCIMQKDHAKEEKYTNWKFLRKLICWKNTNGLHIEDSQRISSTQRYFKRWNNNGWKNAIMIQMPYRWILHFIIKELKQYQVRIHPDTGESGRIDTVFAVEEMTCCMYIFVNVTIPMRKMQETPVTSKDKENFSILSAFSEI